MSKYYLGFKPDIGAEESIKAAVAHFSGDCAPLEPTPFDRIHVTTLFLGDVSKEDALAVLGASQACREFVVSAADVGAFGTKALYLLVEGGELLRALHETQCAAAKARIGRVQSSGWVPHLTLFKTPTKPPETEAYVNLFNALQAELSGLNLFHQFLVNKVGLYEKSVCIDEVELRS